MSPSRAGAGVWAARAALLLGIPSALVSAYWGLGGTWLLDTIGGALEREGRAGNPGLIAIVWLTVALKLVASVIGLAALHPPARLPVRLIRLIGWTAGGMLFLYGLILTVVGLLVESGVIATSVNANHRALRWHAFLWDPWFFLWGLCVLIAMHRSRHPVRKQS